MSITETEFIDKLNRIHNMSNNEILKISLIVPVIKNMITYATDISAYSN